MEKTLTKANKSANKIGLEKHKQKLHLSTMFKAQKSNLYTWLICKSGVQT